METPNLPNLNGSGSNWVIYRERLVNGLISIGLRRHILGTAIRPPTPLEKDRKFYKSEESSTPLTEEEIEKMEQAIDAYEQKEAQTRLLIWGTMSDSMFLQVKDYHRASIHEMWRAIVKIVERRTKIVHMVVWQQFRTIGYDPKDANMRSHIESMVTLRDRLLSTGHLVMDEDFVLHIQRSVISIPAYRQILNLINASTGDTHKLVESETLIQFLLVEWGRLEAAKMKR
ncbi:hypothetical protein AX16_001231 [Volvariella volvacea WC 439]|nr:hypothetical protein AX16_001231 [Volvariella volvacea WC 439]